VADAASPAPATDSAPDATAAPKSGAEANPDHTPAAQ